MINNKPFVQKVESFLVSGIETRTRNEDETNPDTAKISPLWQRFIQEDIESQIPEQSQTSNIYGVYDNYESDVNGLYTLTAGKRVDTHPQTKNWHTVSIAKGDYLVFENQGEMPGVLYKTWQHVWQYFQQNPAIERAYQTDFEVYDGDKKVAIYIGLKD